MGGMKLHKVNFRYFAGPGFLDVQVSSAPWRSSPDFLTSGVRAPCSPCWYYHAAFVCVGVLYRLRRRILVRLVVRFFDFLSLP